MFATNHIKNRAEGLLLGLVLGFFLMTPGGVNAQNDSAWNGRDLFQDKGCIQCHAIYGEGGRKAPDLGKRKFYGTYLELAASLWNHFPRMRRKMEQTGFQYPQLSEQEMGDIITYLSYIRYLGEPGNEARGKKLLQTKSCIKCHKFGGKGGNIGPNISAMKEYISPLKLVQAMWNHGPNIMKMIEKYKTKRPEFQGNEIIDLAVAIRSFMSPTKVPPGAFAIGDPKKGEKLAKGKACMRCHSFRGVGGKVGPDFANVDLNYSVTQIAGKMWNHGPKMWEKMKSMGIPFPTFKQEEMADIIAYIYGLKLQGPEGNAEQGKKLVQKKGCLSCHSLRGEGAGISADLAKIGPVRSPQVMIAAMWNHAPSMEKKIREKKLKWPKFTGKEMANLYAFLRSLNKTKPAEN